MVMAKHKRIMANGKITRAIKPCEAKISTDLDATQTLVQRWKSIKENKEVRRKKESTLSTKKK